MAETKNLETTKNAPSEETPTERQSEKKSKGVYCEKCNFSHTDNFDGPGIGHWPFPKGGQEEKQFYFYCSEPKKSIFVTLDIGEKMSSKSIPIVTPQINGLKVGIVKGHYVDVPKSIAEVLMDSYNQTAAISSNAKTAPNPYTGKVSNARLDMREDDAKAALNV